MGWTRRMLALLQWDIFVLEGAHQFQDERLARCRRLEAYLLGRLGR